MTPAEINKAIAESLGWHSFKTGAYIGNLFGTPTGSHDCIEVPDFSHSLDACRLFEKKITSSEERYSYQTELYQLIETSCLADEITIDYWMITATSAQRCEAYLRMRGLWKEETK